MERDGNNFGLLSRNYPGIDIDVTRPGLADICESQATATFGPAPRRGRTGSCKVLLMYRCADHETLRKRRFVFKDQSDTEHAVELLATGQQYVVDGVHPDGGAYGWNEQPSPYDLNPITGAMWDTYCRALAERLRRVAGVTVVKDGLGGAAASGTVKRAGDPAPEPSVDPITAMMWMKEQRGDAHGEPFGHDQFVDLCAAFRGAAGDHADELYDEFRELCPGGRDVDGNTHKTYHSFDVGERLGWSRLCQITGFTPPDAFAEPVNPDDMPEAPENVAFKAALKAATARYAYVRDLDRIWDTDCTAILTASQFNACSTSLARHGAKGEKSAYSAFLNARERRTVASLTYRPGAGPFVAEERDGKDFECANTWRPGIEPRPGAVPDVWLKQGDWLLGKQQFNVLRQWLGYVMQNPGVKVGWTPVIVGPQGVGKDALFSPIRHALGARNVACIDFSRLTDKFNADWAQKQFLIANEAKISDRRKAADAYNQLKTLFSSIPAIRKVEEKNVPIWYAPNIQVGVILSNHHDAVALEHDDRRFGVFQCVPTRKPDNHEEFFAPYFEWCPRDDAPGADASARRKTAGADVLGYLLDLDVSGFKPETAPDTEAKRTMVRAHRPDNAETWVADAFDEEGILHGRDVIAFDEFQGLLKQAEYPSSTNTVAQLLRRHGFAKRDRKVRIGVGGPEKFLWLKDSNHLVAQLSPAELAKRYLKQSAETQSAVAEALKAEGWQ
jgi:hypothetical protein